MRLPAVARFRPWWERPSATDKPLAVISMNEWYQGPGSEVFDADPRVSTFRSADRCFAALRAWTDWHDRRIVQPAFRGGPTLGLRTQRERSSRKARVRAWPCRSRIPSACLPPTACARRARRSRAIHGLGGRGRQAHRLPRGRENFLKRHSSQDGGWRHQARPSLGAEVRAAAREILASAKEREPDARIDGVSVRQMLTAGVEIVIGVKRDQRFRPPDRRRPGRRHGRIVEGRRRPYRAGLQGQRAQNG